VPKVFHQSLHACTISVCILYSVTVLTALQVEIFVTVGGRKLEGPRAGLVAGDHTKL